jgi:hypothetical protein
MSAGGLNGGASGGFTWATATAVIEAARSSMTKDFRRMPPAPAFGVPGVGGATLAELGSPRSVS